MTQHAPARPDGSRPSRPRARLEVRYWPGTGRIRPVLALHRLPDPHCPQCFGSGSIRPAFDACPCAPDWPLAAIWLPHWGDMARQRHLRRRRGHLPQRRTTG
ncbi:hypothetical protein [Streptomyces sp. NPDC052496]|uniref:hypothetical protein n=1 Tax=Streptomyces sp. NPDC052496 TaxID=3154951 RepID=UPI003430A776